MKYFLKQPPEPAPQTEQLEVLSASDYDHIKSFISATAINQCMPYWQVGPELSLLVSDYTRQRAVRLNGMNRRVTQVKPYRSESTCQRHLIYTLEQKS